MNRKLMVGLITVAILFAGCSGRLCLKRVEPVTTIKCSALTYSEPGNMVFKDTESWESFWKNHCTAVISEAGSIPNTPQVDFSSQMLVCVFAGEKPTGGYGIVIQRVREGSKSLIVEYSEKSPDPKMMLSQVITYPCHIVAIPTSEKSVEFKKVKK